MEIKAKEIELVDINSLVPHPKNNNKHPKEQIDRLVKILEYQGFRNPVTVQKGTNLIVCGHGRVEAAKKLGISQVPVIYQEFDSEAQLYAHLTADNAIASWAELDLSEVNNEVIDLGPDFDIDVLGIKDFVIEPIEKYEPQADEDEVPEVEHPITKRGDIWLLGNHRLMCGDSTMIDNVEKLMNGEKADMVFTDPPYGMSLDANYSSMENYGFKSTKRGNKYDNVKGDHEDFKPELIQTIFTAFNYCEEIFLWGADYYADLLPERNSGSWVVWDKRLDESADKMFGSTFELCWSKAKHKRMLARVKWAGIFGMEKQDTKKRCHPTQKPIELIDWFFDYYSLQDKKKCADLYLGSGTTLISCEKNSKQCYGMELEEKYCDIIINRWQNYTGQKATLELTGQTYEELKDERLNV